MRRIVSIVLGITLSAGLLVACGTSETNNAAGGAEGAIQAEQMSAVDGATEGASDGASEEITEPEPIQREEYVIKSPIYTEGMEVPEGYEVYEGVVEHLFFHPVVAYPEVAFTGSQANGIDDWMVTVGEYNKILQSLYDKGYILVDINDIWSEYTTEDGVQRMGKNKLLIPAGKKPLVFSYDDVNYYEYMLENGFTYKLILGEDGLLWSYGKDPQGNDVVSQDLDAVTILDKFVREHPDFSPYGAKGCLSLTGFEGILGYRTQTDRSLRDAAAKAEHEAYRQLEIEAVRPIIEELKRTGWTFGCHTWGHINLDSKGMGTIQNDMERWTDEVGSLIGETTILFYPHGARPDGGDWKQTGEEFRYLQGLGYRVLCSVGVSSFSHIKTDISAVICDRLHPDGTTLRSARSLERYMKFYDAREVIDLDSRPKRAVEWLNGATG